MKKKNLIYVLPLVLSLLAGCMAQPSEGVSTGNPKSNGPSLGSNMINSDAPTNNQQPSSDKEKIIEEIKEIEEEDDGQDGVEEEENTEENTEEDSDDETPTPMPNLVLKESAAITLNPNTATVLEAPTQDPVCVSGTSMTVTRFTYPLPWICVLTGDLVIQGGLAEIDLDEILPNLREVQAYIKIHHNPNGEHLLGLSQLTHIGGGVIIHDNDELQEIDFLLNISILSEITIFENPGLEDLSGLTNIEEVNGDINIYDNLRLDIDDIHNVKFLRKHEWFHPEIILTGGGLVDIHDNGGGVPDKEGPKVRLEMPPLKPLHI